MIPFLLIGAAVLLVVAVALVRGARMTDEDAT